MNTNEELITSKRRANEMLARFLELKNNRYSFNLSVDKAIEMGLSENAYKGALLQLEQTNKIIEESEKDPNCDLTLTNPQEVKSLAPSGTLTTNGQEEASDSFWAPSEISFIRFRCRTNAAPTPVYTCKTYSLGNWRTKTAIGSLFSTTTIDVDIVASNTSVRVYFKTSDSNGGSATWEAKE